MPFEPKPREVRLHLDRWLVLGDNREQARKWLMRAFNIRSRSKRSEIGDSWTVVSPWFDPVDIFEARICTEESSIYGQQFYNFVDIRSKLAVLHDAARQCQADQHPRDDQVPDADPSRRALCPAPASRTRRRRT